MVANESIDHWYINNKTVGSYLQSDNYVLWEGCTRSRGYCGGTLFIKHANMELNEIVVCCQALHETCSGRKATLSESATLFGAFNCYHIDGWWRSVYMHHSMACYMQLSAKGMYSCKQLKCLL